MPPVQVTVASVLQGIDKPEARDVAGPMTVIIEDFRPLWVAGLFAAWLLRRLAGHRPKPSTVGGALGLLMLGLIVVVIMPVVMLVMLYTMPSALILYWTSNTVMSIIQLYWQKCGMIAFIRVS